MTTAERVIAHPVLENGDVMTRKEFHRLYSECEGFERVELIEGVVYLPSPVRVQGHSDQHGLMMDWLSAYAALHADVKWSPPGSVLLDERNEPEPDAMMYYLRADRFEDGYLKGAPELIVEIANTSRARDLHQKKAAYERNGVLEYIVWRVRDEAIDWFQLRERKYVARQPDRRGLIVSDVFSELVLDVPAMLAQDRTKVLAALGGR